MTLRFFKDLWWFDSSSASVSEMFYLFIEYIQNKISNQREKYSKFDHQTFDSVKQEMA